MTVLSPYLTAPTTQPSPSSTSSTPTAMTPTPSSITQINSSSPSSPPYLPLVKIDACLVSGAERLTIPSSKTLSPFNRPPPLRPLRRMSSTGTKIELQPNTNPLERRLDLFGLHTSSSEGPLNDLVIGGECGLENRGEALGAQTTPNENWIAHHLSAVLQHSFTVSSPHPITSSPSAYSSTTNHNSSCPARRVLETLHNKLSLTSLSSFTASNTTTDDDDEEDEEADEACSQVSVGSICSYLKSSDSESLNFIGRSPVSFPSNFVPSSLPRSILHQMTSQPHSSTSRPVLLRVLNTWSFDANNLSPLQIRCSLHILLSVFIKYNHEFSQKLESMGVIRLEACLANLVRNLEAAYDPRNAYHNFRHAVDVVQAVYTILSHEGVVPSLDWVIRKETEGDESMNWHRQPIGRLGHALDDMTIWALLLAAAGHDVGHPGLSNAFMVNARTPIAYVFSDGAVLENFHRITFTRMLREHGFQKLVDGSIGFRRVLAGCVLATDMGRHFPIVEELKQLHCSWEALSAEQKITEEQVLSEKVLIAAGIIKCGDISNSSRPHPISLTWSSCLLSEWSRQAALEAELSLPISVVTLDRTEKKAQAKSQVGFTSLFALPLFTVMEQLSPGSFRPFAENCRLGLKTWQKVAESFDGNLPLNVPQLTASPSVSQPPSSIAVSNDCSPLEGVSPTNDNPIALNSPNLADSTISPRSSPHNSKSVARTSTVIEACSSSEQAPEITCLDSAHSLSTDEDVHLTPKPSYGGWWASSLPNSEKSEGSTLSKSCSSIWTVRKNSRDGFSGSGISPPHQQSEDISSSSSRANINSSNVAQPSPRHSLKICVPNDSEVVGANNVANTWPTTFSDESKANSVADDSSFSSFGSPSSPPRSPFFTPGVSSASSVESTADATDQRHQNASTEAKPLEKPSTKSNLTSISILRPSQRPRDKGMSLDYGLVRTFGKGSPSLRRQAYSPHLVNQQVACARGCGKVTVKCVKCATESKLKMHRSLSLAKPYDHLTLQPRRLSGLRISETHRSGDMLTDEKAKLSSQYGAALNARIARRGIGNMNEAIEPMLRLKSKAVSGASPNQKKTDHSWPPYPFRPHEL